ncbi:MAG: RsmE family RNA methyltransferase [Oscillospiraceae bacterium]|nr:RsmE family RNA methyltransferase [Oscillospiraceae bacterium]
MPRFFKENFKSQPYIDGSDASHIARSLRMKIGEQLTVSDTAGTDFLCEITAISAERVDFNILKSVENKTEATVSVTLYQCLPKADKMDSIVQQSVELGVTKIVPVLSERCISRPDAKSMHKKIERWQKIAFEAAGQSGRGMIPKVCECISFAECYAQMKDYDCSLFFYEMGGNPIQDSVNSTIKTASVVIGPEGGFDVKEAEDIQVAGAICSTLGPRILRAQTAPIAAITSVMLLSGNLNR